MNKVYFLLQLIEVTVEGAGCLGSFAQRCMPSSLNSGQRASVSLQCAAQSSDGIQHSDRVSNTGLMKSVFDILRHEVITDKATGLKKIELQIALDEKVLAGRRQVYP